ncbi:MAG TPA: NAD(P)-dependent oxidoreductase [Actinomycetes bacterium]|nr:NAD(P)-dependent oxidoreductase [Actinomycetes bacterium]
MGQRVCVTGASGQAGRAVVRELRAHGFDVVTTDLAATRSDLEGGMLRADLTDYGQVLEVLQGPEETWWPDAAAGQQGEQVAETVRGVDAVVHMANIPAPGIATPATTFNTNVTMNFNVFMAAAKLGVSRVVWASSETTLGLPFDVPPRYAPVDEDHYAIPTMAYALSKVISETIAGHISQWSGVPFIALRFSNIMEPTDYRHFPSFWGDPYERKWNLWGYVDERDVAAACRLALTAPAEAVAGSPSFIIAASDTVMNRPSAELLAEVFPDVALRTEVEEFGTLLAIDRARKVLGYEPSHSWRDHVSASGEPIT